MDRMRVNGFFVGVFAFWCLSAPLAWADAAAKADLLDANGNSVGAAEFNPAADGVRMDVNIKGLQPGKHGIHIHAAGNCEAPDFKSAGPHFNPQNKKHGLSNPEGSHAGDLPNLEVDAEGNASPTATLKGASLGEGEDSLLHEGGTAVVIHAAEDDEVTDPSGNSGDRIACGVIAAS